MEIASGEKMKGKDIDMSSTIYFPGNLILIQLASYKYRIDRMRMRTRMRMIETEGRTKPEKYLTLLTEYHRRKGR